MQVSLEVEDERIIPCTEWCKQSTKLLGKPAISSYNHSVNTSVPYYDLLLRLALYQNDQPASVQFHFQALPASAGDQEGSNQPFDPDPQLGVLVRPVLGESNGMDTLPLFNFPDLDPLRLWVNFGYAALVSGSLEDGTGRFALTPNALGLDPIQAGG